MREGVERSDRKKMRRRMRGKERSWGLEGKEMENIFQIKFE
jgi:hypothetical protein